MILFAWDGFPQYAARCVGAFAGATVERVAVIATRPDVPISGMEDVCGCEIVWAASDDSRTLREIFGEMPNLAVVSGWSVPLFNRYRDEIHAEGGRVISIFDNNWEFPSPSSFCSFRFLRECVKAIRFRLLFRGKYEGFFVPGRSGRRLLHLYGVDDARIHTGVYAADKSLFHNGAPLADRARKIVYVGRFNERKNVLRLVRAFQRISFEFPDWTLDLYGSGPLKKELQETISNQAISSQTIFLHDFLQPDELAAKYREARVFILPSLWEHWGLVVHEAALSGCVLLLGSRTGAADDLLGEANGARFDPYSVESMAEAMKRAMSMTDEELRAAQAESLRLAESVSIARFVDSVREMQFLKQSK